MAETAADADDKAPAGVNVAPDIDSEKRPAGPNGADSTPDAAGPPYTVFSAPQRWRLVLLLGYLGLASSLTANIYMPLLTQLAAHYRVSRQAVNLTITVFFVFQGVAPSFWSPMSDVVGRRPIFLATFSVYTLASLGLAVPNRAYPALLVLRALQSVGGSSVLSLAYACLADVTVHAKRGRFLWPMMTAINVGPSIGPILGGAAITSSGDPRWCFLALLVFGATAWLLIGFMLPETGRAVVGNGAVPPQGLWRTWWHAVLRKPATPTPSAEAVAAPVNAGKTGRGKPVVPNPLTSLFLLRHPDALVTLIVAGTPYAGSFATQATMSPVFGGLYHWSPLMVGLSFLAGGVGTLLAGWACGRLLDYNYRGLAQAHGLPVDRKRGVDIATFPLEAARSRFSIRISLFFVLSYVGYGWAVQQRAHVAVPLVLTGCLRFRSTLTHQTFSTLIVDVFPHKTGTAAAANNIVRCSLAAVMLAVVDPLTSSIGYGWTFTLLGLLDTGSTIVGVLVLRRWGRGWRDRRTNSASTAVV